MHDDGVKVQSNWQGMEGTHHQCIKQMTIISFCKIIKEITPRRGKGMDPSYGYEDMIMIMIIDEGVVIIARVEYLSK